MKYRVMKCLGGKLGGEVVSEYDNEADAQEAILDEWFGEPKADRCEDTLDDGTPVWVFGAGDYYMYVD